MGCTVNVPDPHGFVAPGFLECFVGGKRVIADAPPLFGVYRVCKEIQDRVDVRTDEIS